MERNFRFCIQYQALNVVTLRYSYPFLHMNECFNLTGDVWNFSTLDTSRRYCKEQLSDTERNKSVFTNHHSLYLFSFMLFGIKNALCAFQCAMDVPLLRLKLHFTVVYLEDMIVFSRFSEEHIDHEQQIFTLVYYTSLTLKLNRCQLFTNQVDYPSHLNMHGHLEVPAGTICTILRLAHPTSMT